MKKIVALALLVAVVAPVIAEQAAEEGKKAATNETVKAEAAVK